ncbi:SMI1/KNR4 family protein [Acinetobacter geminorum]
MKIENIKGCIMTNHPIIDEQRIVIEKEFNQKLPDEYFQLLKLSDGLSFENGVIIYSSGEVLERNQTYEVQKYAGDYISIGDDSGGRSILIPFLDSGVFIVDQGSMDPDDMEKIAHSLIDWVNTGCLIE